jgi:hypothetical protein
LKPVRRFVYSVRLPWQWQEPLVMTLDEKIALFFKEACTV